MKIILVIVAWIACAVITAGCIIFFDEAIEDEEDLLILVGLSLVMWPIFLLMGAGKLILKELSKLSLFVAGFINSMRGGDEDG